MAHMLAPMPCCTVWVPCTRAHVPPLGAGNTRHHSGLEGFSGFYQVQQQACEVTPLAVAPQGKHDLVFIVGRGNHSAGGVQKLKPAVEQLAREERLTAIPNKPSQGPHACVFVCARVPSAWAILYPPQPPPGPAGMINGHHTVISPQSCCF